MSSPASRALSGGESLSSTRPLLLYLYFCAIAILYYDHLLTFPGEVEYVWRRPKSRSAYWFFLNRYLTFFTTLPITVFNFVQFDHDSCRKYALFRQVLLVIQVVVVDVILSLRVYAMYGLNKRILYILGVGVVVGFGITGWAISTQSNARDLEDYSVAGCFLPLSSKSGTRKSTRHLAAVWEALFAYDLLIFGIILSRSAQLWLRSRGATSTPIISLMLRDGALYFVVMELANLTNIITFYVGGPFIKGGLSTFATSVSVTMTSRLMLNLHALAERGLYSEVPAQNDWAGMSQTLDTILPESHTYAEPDIELTTYGSSAP
ncbi:hypothetical protein B0H11DRAFT_2291395 [Mycena galericulata]|nr:hypothetical protein B0H11DRAFT_2291395 [Mycena galericulata]